MSGPGARIGLHAGWLAGAVFLVALLVVGALAPGYSHATQPVSFMGMTGAPLAAWWNVFGFIGPGLLIAAFAVSLYKAVQHPKSRMTARIGAWMLLIAGLAFAGNGVFVFDPSDPGGASTKLHVTMLTLALLGFLPATLALAFGLRGRAGWRALVLIGPVMALATAVSVVQRMWDFVPLLAAHPGYAQRVTLGLFFAWVLLASLVALRASRLPLARQPDES